MGYSDRDVLEETDKKFTQLKAEYYLKIAKSKIKSFGIDYSYFGKYVSDNEKNEARSIAANIKYNMLDNFNYNNIDLGKNIKSSVIRYLKGKQYSDKYKKILIEFTYTAILNNIAAKNVIEILKPSIVFMSHGIYADWGPALKTFTQKEFKLQLTSTHIKQVLFL